MRWFIPLFLMFIVRGENVTNMTNITCSNGLCVNNTCAWGYYNNTQECIICSQLRPQYREERCCDLNSVTSTPFTELIIDSIYENDTNTILIRYTPPRDICHHLWIEWGRCPPICDNVLPGFFCSMDIDCKDTNLCLNSFCCYVKDENCLSCANETGYCDQCAFGMGFNATGNYTCAPCPLDTYLTNNTCHMYSNCSVGEYIAQEATNITDRICTVVPYGYYSNIINAQNITPWTNCSNVNNTWTTFYGNTTHDVICTNHTLCEANFSYTFYGNYTHDATCVNSSMCQNVTCLDDP